MVSCRTSSKPASRASGRTGAERSCGAPQGQRTGLSSQAAAALDAAGLPSDLLIFEITENVVMEDLAGAREVMTKLD